MKSLKYRPACKVSWTISISLIIAEGKRLDDLSSMSPTHSPYFTLPPSPKSHGWGDIDGLMQMPSYALGYIIRENFLKGYIHLLMRDTEKEAET